MPFWPRETLSRAADQISLYRSQRVNPCSTALYLHHIYMTPILSTMSSERERSPKSVIPLGIFRVQTTYN